MKMISPKIQKERENGENVFWNRGLSFE